MPVTDKDEEERQKLLDELQQLQAEGAGQPKRYQDFVDAYPELKIQDPQPDYLPPPSVLDQPSIERPGTEPSLPTNPDYGVPQLPDTRDRFQNLGQVYATADDNAYTREQELQDPNYAVQANRMRGQREFQRLQASGVDPATAYRQVAGLLNYGDAKALAQGLHEVPAPVSTPGLPSNLKAISITDGRGQQIGNAVIGPDGKLHSAWPYNPEKPNAAQVENTHLTNRAIDQARRDLTGLKKQYNSDPYAKNRDEIKQQIADKEAEIVGLETSARSSVVPVPAAQPTSEWHAPMLPATIAAQMAKDAREKATQAKMYFGPKGGEPAALNGNPNPAVQPAAPAIPKVTSQDAYDSLPKGSVYVGQDGKRYRKP